MQKEMSMPAVMESLRFWVLQFQIQQACSKMLFYYMQTESRKSSKFYTTVKHGMASTTLEMLKIPN